MNSILLVGVLAVVLLLSIQQSKGIKSFRTTVYTSLMSLLITTLMFEISLLHGYTLHTSFISLGLPIIALIGLIVLMSRLQVDLHKILAFSFANTALILIFVILPIILMLSYWNEVFHGGNFNFALLDYFKLVIRYLIYLAIIMLTYHLARKILIKKIVIDGLLIMSFSLVIIFSSNSTSADDYRLIDANLSFRKELTIDTEKNFLSGARTVSDFNGDDLYYILQIPERDDNTYIYCTYNITEENNLCHDNIEFNNRHLSHVLFTDNFYFVSENGISVISADTATILYVFPEGFEPDEFAFYIDEDSLFFETPSTKLLVNNNSVTEVSEYTSIYENNLEVKVTDGHLLLQCDPSTISIDGVTYNSESISDILFFDDLVTNGKYKFEDNELVKISDNISNITLIINKYYFSNYSTNTYINIYDKTDIVYFNGYMSFMEHIKDDLYYNNFSNTIERMSFNNRKLLFTDYNNYYSLVPSKLNYALALFTFSTFASFAVYKKTYRKY